MAEWLERAVAVREISGSIPCRGGHKPLCIRRKPSGYVSFRRTVKRQWFHTLKYTIQSQEHSLQILHTLDLDLDLGPFPADVNHFLPNDQ